MMARRSRFLPSPAMVVALVALVLSLGGSGYAASMTLFAKNSDMVDKLHASKTPRPGTLLALDKNGKLPASALTLVKGPTGDQGAQGPKGDTGQRGPSDGFGSSASGNVPLGTSESSAVVVDSLDLAAGKWLVVAATGLTNSSGAERSAWCELKSERRGIWSTLPPQLLGTAVVFDQAKQRSAAATVLGQVELPTVGTVTLQCWADGSGVSTPSGSRPAIEAIGVASLTFG